MFLGVAVGLVDCAVEAVVYVDLAPFLCGLGGDGLCRCTDGEDDLGRVGLWRGRCPVVHWRRRWLKGCGLVRSGGGGQPGGWGGVGR